MCISRYGHGKKRVPRQARKDANGSPQIPYHSPQNFTSRQIFVLPMTPANFCDHNHYLHFTIYVQVHHPDLPPKLKTVYIHVRRGFDRVATVKLLQIHNKNNTGPPEHVVRTSFDASSRAHNLPRSLQCPPLESPPLYRFPHALSSMVQIWS